MLHKERKPGASVRFISNTEGPTIGVVSAKVKEADGLFFRSLTSEEELKPYEDWREPAAKRAAALAADLSVEEKIGLIFCDSLRMGIAQTDESLLDETGLLDEEIIEAGKSIFNDEKTYGTTRPIKEFGLRHFILRENPTPTELVNWLNQLNALTEECAHHIPVQMVSNSRNENGEVVFGMNDAAGVFPAWPGTLGIAAAIRGCGDLTVADDFADVIRRDWEACGLRKGYMYMADIITDPRWQRSYGTFGEDPALVGKLMQHLIPGIQGSADGVTSDGVAVTIKHFPGGGARENGFDPHYAQGQWNIYATPDSLLNYHLPAFRQAVSCNPASIMPYYAKLAEHKSAPQHDLRGNLLPMEEVGFAYNHYLIQDILKNQMGYKGYINSDSGITMSMAWGMESYDIPERIAKAIANGVDLISGSFDVVAAREAYDRGLLTDEDLTRAVTATLTEMFALGMMDNPYRDPALAEDVVATPSDWEKAYRVHQQSIVVLKNKKVLPLSTENKLPKVYVEGLKADPSLAEGLTAYLKDLLKQEEDMQLTDDPAKADLVFMYCEPSSGEYFNATMGYLELDLCDGKIVCDVDEEGRPAQSTHTECTLANVDRIRQLSELVHQNGGKMMVAVNFTLAWMLGNVEPYADLLLAGFDTYPKAMLDIITGRCEAVGRLPFTLPRCDEVIAVNPDGVCISPNDVPGYDKDHYLPASLMDENGKFYAYRDSEGNYYELDFAVSIRK